MSADLSFEQRAAVESTSGELVVVAGPGSGKTRVVVERVRWLVGSMRAAPADVAVVTFTNGAADEMRRRLGEMAARVGYIGTLHGLMLRALRSGFEACGYGRPPAVLGEDEADETLEKVLQESRVKGVTIAEVRRVVQSPDRRLNIRTPNKAEQVAVAYFGRLKDSNLVDFDGILLDGLVAARDAACDPLGWVKELVVDEVQDSSDADFAIYDWLLSRGAARTMVGDPDQAIYGFRGGRVGNLLALCADQLVDKATLEDNYRSATSVCAAAQRLISRNAARYEKRTAPVTDAEGSACACEFPREDQELAWLAQDVRQANDGRDWKECAVLCRTNWLAQRVAKGLQSYSIPVFRRGELRTPDDWWKARRLASACADLDNPELALRAVEVLRGKQAADDLRRRSYLDMRPASARDLLPMADDTPAAVVVALNELAVLSSESVALLARLADGVPPGGSASDLILAMDRETDVRETDEPGVAVCTMHSAKGLEWDYVWVVGCEDGTTPITRGDADLEEERRLMYVAMTRARSGLALTHCRQRKPSQPEWAKPEPRAVSRFVEEAGI